MPQTLVQIAAIRLSDLRRFNSKLQDIGIPRNQKQEAKIVDIIMYIRNAGQHAITLGRKRTTAIHSELLL